VFGLITVTVLSVTGSSNEDFWTKAFGDVFFLLSQMPSSASLSVFGGTTVAVLSASGSSRLLFYI